MYECAKTFEDAKKLVASPAGVELEKYPLKFVTPAYFGPRPQRGIQAKVNSGSASLLSLNGQSFALTCWHVLEAYRERLQAGCLHPKQVIRRFVVSAFRTCSVSVTPRPY